MPSDGIIAGSFRDPSGFIYKKNGILFRQIQKSYAENYDQLVQSQLAQTLQQKKMLIDHTEESYEWGFSENAYKIIRPSLIPFVSYPYEWSFTQLKDAALVTLNVQLESLKHNMCLKDATAYNIQFKDGKAIFIDTLSFEKYQPGEAWIAYRQFCQHFLAPLLLMQEVDIRLSQLLKVNIDGIPLDLASTLLPMKSYLSFSCLSHIHLHSKSQKKFEEDTQIDVKKYQLKKERQVAIVENLHDFVSDMSWKPQGTEWADYYNDTNYDDKSLESKRTIVDNYIQLIQPQIVYDFGANNGYFSQLSADRNIPTIAFDIDPAAVEQHYLKVKKTGHRFILPLLMDLTNPSPSLGWNLKERDSLVKRGHPGLGLSLALIHHLAIGNNIPLKQIAQFFAQSCQELILEFVPKEDSQVKRLLVSRQDIFSDYHLEGFEKSFSDYFTILDKKEVLGSKRWVFLLRRRDRTLC